MSNKPEQLNLAAIRKRLEGARGREYWRSLEELAETEGFDELLHREFPRQASEWVDNADGDSRRTFLKLMGASLGLAGLSACTKQPTEHIMPYVRQPAELIPGKPLFFATAMPFSGGATGLLVESHEGRPTKAEGNPEHPATLGACDIFAQASVLQLYDPDRSQVLSCDGEIRSWGAFLGTISDALTQQKAKQGAGLRILTETVTSPTLADQIQSTLKEFPKAKWHAWEPAGPHSARAGARLAFGEPVNTTYDLLQADVILSLDSDFLSSHPANLRGSREFAARRRVRGSQSGMNRLYVVETTPTPTGSKADHRLPLRSCDVENFAWAVAAGLGIQTGGRKQPADAPYAKWVGPVVRDLQKHRGGSLVLAGDHQSPAVHTLAHAMNQELGNVGKTVFYTDAIEAQPADQLASLHDLVKDLDAGVVDVLLIAGGNPVYTAPVEIGMRDRIQKARLRIHLGLYEDETSEVCQWHLPETHYLEAWGDTRSYDGTVTVMQPLIGPLYDGRSTHELLTMLTKDPERKGYDIVKSYWKSQYKGGDFEGWWRKTLHDGFIAGSALPRRNVSVNPNWVASAPAPPAPEKLEVVFRPSPALYDGRFSNNGWLQEFPQPITKMTWDNPALISPATAERLQLQSGDLVNLQYRGRWLRAPVLIQPGHAADTVTVYLGYGRTRAGKVGTGQGFNAYGLRTSDALWSDQGLDVRKVGSGYPLAHTQNAHVIDTRRKLMLHGDIEEYRKNPDFIHEQAEAPPPGLTLYPPYKYDNYAWGMAIDLNACTGCGACILACQAENNIPVVGKDQVFANREMHWVRLDTYYEGGLDNPRTFNQPVPCMQCENAPCELVCPVQATSHSSEGLNDMVYNRCVGTRYCSNNCPYKVRRFNFFLFSDYTTPSLKLLHNPDVTVRSRGVMEKCTYCVQRINYAKIEAEKENRKVRDGDIQTACQATCPSEAIVFGDINDPNSRVSKMKAEKLNYSLLAELNTRPRTTYLASLRNPNPEMEA